MFKFSKPKAINQGRREGEDREVRGVGSERRSGLKPPEVIAFGTGFTRVIRKQRTREISHDRNK